MSRTYFSPSGCFHSTGGNAQTPCHSLSRPSRPVTLQLRIKPLHQGKVEDRAARLYPPSRGRRVESSGHAVTAASYVPQGGYGLSALGEILSQKPTTAFSQQLGTVPLISPSGDTWSSWCVPEERNIHHFSLRGNNRSKFDADVGMWLAA